MVKDSLKSIGITIMMLTFTKYFIRLLFVIHIRHWYDIRHLPNFKFILIIDLIMRSCSSSFIWIVKILLLILSLIFLLKSRTGVHILLFLFLLLRWSVHLHIIRQVGVIINIYCNILLRKWINNCLIVLRWRWSWFSETKLCWF